MISYLSKNIQYISIILKQNNVNMKNNLMNNYV